MENNNNNEKVMSDEQIQTLRMQIALYDYICDMLADLHNCYVTLQPSLPNLPLTLQPSPPDLSLTLQPSLLDLPLPEVEVENTQQKGPLTLYGARRWKRWTPTKEQIEILESLFKEGNETHPNKQKIKKITVVLSQHGQVSDANVYNWFQNRRARLKKKMHDSKNQMMTKKVFRFDQLVSPSICYNNNNNNNNNNNDDDQVESSSWVNNYVTF